MKLSRGERWFNCLNVIAFVFFAILCLYPFIYVTALSLNDGVDAMRGEIYFFPRKFTFQNFITIFQDKRIFTSFGISIFRTVLGAGSAVIFNSCFAFAMTKKDLPGRIFFNWYILIPMYFSGGTIPYYLVCKALHLTNNIWVYILPAIIAPFYIIILRTYYLGMPDSLEDAAIIDGANYFVLFFRIYFPLSAPVLATVALLSGVGHWNDWFAGSIMMYDSTKWPLQTLLLSIVQGSDIVMFMRGENFIGSMARKPTFTSESIKMAVLVVTVVPVVMIYPFLQKYFVKGMMVGSLKG